MTTQVGTREFSNTPGGKWSTSDLSPPVFAAPGHHFYLITYVSPASPEDFHQTKVKVDRHDSFVYTRSQYCKTHNSPSDPLAGTIAKRLEDFLVSSEPGKISLSIQTGLFYADTGAARVNISLEFPWNDLQRDWDNVGLSATIGVLGMVNGKDGALASHFSDLGCCANDRPAFWEPILTGSDVLHIPARYETQLDLPPGEYDLQVVLSDGAKFGRVEIPITVGRYDGKQLAISSVVLCKRFRESVVASQEEAAVNLAPKLVPLVSNAIEFTPAGDTRFRKGEPLFAYFEVYEPLLAGTPATTVQTRLRVTDTRTGELRVDTGLQSATSEMTPGKTVIPIAERIAVNKLPAGSYELEVQASDSAGKTTVWRTANFTVE